MPGYYIWGASVQVALPTSQRYALNIAKNGTVSGNTPGAEATLSGNYPTLSVIFVDYVPGTGDYYTVTFKPITAAATNQASIFWSAKLP